MNCKNKAGVTLFELVVVLGILAILSAITIPNMIEWKNNSKLRGAVNNLRGDLQMARSRAIKESTTVTTQFTQNGYTITTAGGQILRDRVLPAGVQLNLANAGTFLDDDADGNPDTSFNSRGIPPPGVAGDLGSVLIQGSTGSRSISVNLVGRIEVI